MLRPFLPTAMVIFVILAALLACTGTTPASNPTDMPNPKVVAANTPLPANTLEPEGTEAPLRATSEPETLPTPASTKPPAQTLSAAPTAAPTISPTPEPAPTPTKEPATLPPGDVIIPLNLNDSEAALSRLSKSEISCLEQVASPDRLNEILKGVRVPVPEEEGWIMACLEDETLLSTFLALFWDSGPLSEGTSACLRTEFEWVDLRAAMTDIQQVGQDNRAGAVFLSGYFTAIACLNLEESDTAAAALGLDPGDRASI